MGKLEFEPVPVPESNQQRILDLGGYAKLVEHYGAGIAQPTDNGLEIGFWTEYLLAA